MGQIRPNATDEQREIFKRGEAVALHRFTRAEGLGPSFNVTFCAACHERPTFGGAAGHYRDFDIGGRLLPDGTYGASPSPYPLPDEESPATGSEGGVVRIYQFRDDGSITRPASDPQFNHAGGRNPIPFFGVGLLAEIPEEEITRYADPTDADGDGISGRVNLDRGFVGRFGVKAQTVSIEGFIRGPLFNHLGITSDNLSQVDKANLPVDSSNPDLLRADAPAWKPKQFGTKTGAQSAAPDEPNADSDTVPDPELASDDLFALVSWAMLLAAPEPGPPTEETERGRKTFDVLRCGACHVPRLVSPRGPLPVYSDLLLHDMGPELADGLPAGLATGSEFRTQPLWGLTAVGPYLHDGRAKTIRQAIEMHGGEAQTIRDNAMKLTEAEWTDLLAFLENLGGKDQYTPGLVAPNTPLAEPGEYGGPVRTLDDTEAADFLAGRTLFDTEFSFSDGLGAPRFNGDSCRACHFEPVLGGAGPQGVNVMRHGIIGTDGRYTEPAIGNILHRQTQLSGALVNVAQSDAAIFEARQTPHLFGLGLIDAIPDEVILANADPNDELTPDGIRGRPSWTDGDRLGRFGWKASIPSVPEFVRDAVSTELGFTVPWRKDELFGKIHDDDGIPDPEFPESDIALLTRYLLNLGGPPRTPSDTPDLVAAGEVLFATVGCASCHIPTLEGPSGPVPLYSDLLLHEILPAGSAGIEEGSAGERDFRTAPLWGLATSPPYLHNGSAPTIADAIMGHAGEAMASRSAFIALSDTDREALLAFLATL